MHQQAKVLVDDLLEQVNNLERKSREKNLRIIGYPETPGEEPITIVKTVLREKFGMDSVAVDNAHRTGRFVTISGVRKPRHLIFRLVNYGDKHDIMKKKREALKDLDYFITDDMTKADLQKKADLKPVIDEAVRQRKKWKYRNGQLFIDDRLYRGGATSSGGGRQRAAAADGARARSPHQRHRGSPRPGGGNANRHAAAGGQSNRGGNGDNQRQAAAENHHPPGDGQQEEEDNGVDG